MQLAVVPRSSDVLHYRREFCINYEPESGRIDLAARLNRGSINLTEEDSESRRTAVLREGGEEKNEFTMIYREDIAGHPSCRLLYTGVGGGLP